ncbi:MAG: YceI family protein [Saprospiraceae bacterium]
MKKITLSFIFLFLSVSMAMAQGGRYLSQNGRAIFKSEATLELITAKSNSLLGAIEPGTKEFAFSIKINSFQGFNSQIQRDHFLEDYMDQIDFPVATFLGRLIEDIPFNTPGTYSVRAKGMLTIHGVSKERIIKGSITIIPGAAQLTTSFSVPLADHGITIPRIVTQKIAEQIAVTIDIEFAQDSKS